MNGYMTKNSSLKSKRFIQLRDAEKGNLELIDVATIRPRQPMAKISTQPSRSNLLSQECHKN